ncbi:MAG: GntR family transcriptional regulator [Burkholderiales bacterium]|nr:GntR family transcriptional regulator [Burkholderiales bacterium]
MSGVGLDMRPGQRSTTADRVYDVLEKLIISGRLRPGDRLTELSLCAELKVSRTPLRQALQRLVSRGWVLRLPNGAIAVVDVSEEEIEALYAVRAALEALVLRQAVRRMTEGDLARVRDLLKAQDMAAKAGDPDLVSMRGEQFHRTLWALSGNAVGIQFLEDIHQRTTRYRRLSFAKPYRFKEGLRQHWEIVEALASQDVDKACRILQDHVDRSRNYVMQAFRSWRHSSSAPATAPAGTLASPLPDRKQVGRATASAPAAERKAK